MSDKEHVYYFEGTYVIVGTFVRPVLRDALEAVDVQLAQERCVILHLVVFGDQKISKCLGLVDSEGSAVWIPRHNVGLAGLGYEIEHGVKCSGERHVILEFPGRLMVRMGVHVPVEGHAGVVVIVVLDLEFRLATLPALRRWRRAGDSDRSSTGDGSRRYW